MNTTEAAAWPSTCAFLAKSRNHIDQAPIITTECPSIQLLISASQVPNFARISKCCQPFPLIKYFSVNKIRIYLRSWSEQNTLNILSKLRWKSQSFGHLNSLLSITATTKNPACLHQIHVADTLDLLFPYFLAFGFVVSGNSALLIFWRSSFCMIFKLISFNDKQDFY